MRRDKVREALAGKIGNDITLGTVVSGMCSSKEAWKAVSQFAEDVMGRKEQVERDRQARERVIVTSSSWEESS